MTYEEMEMIIRDLLAGREPSISSPEADDFANRFRADMELAKQNGWDIELPFDIQDISDSSKPARFRLKKK